MTMVHPSDTEIQQYVLQEDTCGPDIVGHIATCKTCIARAENYGVLFSAIKEVPLQRIEFDVSGMVSRAFPEPKKSFSLSDPFIYVVSFAAFALIGILAWMYNKDLLRGVTTIEIFMLLVPTAGIVIWQCCDMYKKYQKQITALG
jgi:hypothetical protein